MAKATASQLRREGSCQGGSREASEAGSHQDQALSCVQKGFCVNHGLSRWQCKLSLPARGTCRRGWSLSLLGPKWGY